MSFEQFLKEHKIKLEFTADPEGSIHAYQNIINEILLKNSYLVDDYFEKIMNEEAHQKDISPLISSLKSIFDIWLTITGAESIIDVNRAFDVLLREGYNVNLEQAKLDKIHSVIANENELN